MIPYTTIPFLSAIFLVLVGVLIGHTFWYRFRDHYQFRADHWQQKAQHIHSTLEERLTALTEMEQNSADLCQELSQLRSEYSVLEASSQTLRIERDEFQRQWNQERETRSTLAGNLQDEQRQSNEWKERAISAEKQLVELQQHFSTLSVRLQHTENELELARGPEAASLAARAEERERHLQAQVVHAESTVQELHASLQRQSQQFNAQVDQLSSLQEQKQKELDAAIAGLEMEQQRRVETEAICEQLRSGEHQHSSQCQQLSLEVTRLNEQLFAESERAKDLALQLKVESATRKQIQDAQQHQSRREQVLLDEIVPLRTAAEEAKRLKKELTSTRSLLEQVQQAQTEDREKIDEQNSCRLRLEEELRATRSDLQSMQKKWQATRGDLDTRTAALLAAQNELAARDAELQGDRSKWELLRVETASLADELKATQEELATERSRLGSNDQSLTQLRDEMAVWKQLEQDWHETVAELRGQCEKEASSRKAVEAELLRTRTELARLEPVEDQWVEQEATLRQCRDELRDIKRQRDEALEAVASTKDVIVELRDELAERLESFEISESDRATVVRELHLERQRREQLAEDCVRWQQDCRAVQQQLAEMVEQKTRLSQQIGEWQSRAQQSNQLVSQAEQRIHELALQQERQEEITRRLRSKQLADRGPTSGEGRAGLSFLGLRAKERSLRDQDEMAIQRDSRLGRVYASAPHRVDDLTQIPGLTTDHQAELQRLGIYTFDQMMEWDLGVQHEVAQCLAVGDVIDREDWVGNARRLHHERQRRAA